MARISIDNGNRYYTAEELDMIWDKVEEMNLYDALVYNMDDEIREQVVSEFWGETDKDFVQQYLETATNDLVIG